MADSCENCFAEQPGLYSLWASRHHVQDWGVDGVLGQIPPAVDLNIGKHEPFDAQERHGGPGQMLSTICCRRTRTLSSICCTSCTSCSPATPQAWHSRGRRPGKTARGPECQRNTIGCRSLAYRWGKYTGFHFSGCTFTAHVGGRSPHKLEAHAEKARMEKWAKNRPWQPCLSHQWDASENILDGLDSPHHPPPQHRGQGHKGNRGMIGAGIAAPQQVGVQRQYRCNRIHVSLELQSLCARSPFCAAVAVLCSRQVF